MVPPAPERELDHWKLEKHRVVRDGVLIEEGAVMVPVFKDTQIAEPPKPDGTRYIDGVPVFVDPVSPDAA